MSENPVLEIQLKLDERRDFQRSVICAIHRKEKYMMELMQMLGRKRGNYIAIYEFQYPDSKTYTKSDARNPAEIPAEIQMNLDRARATHMISFNDLISPLEALITSHQRYIEALIKSLFDIETYILEQKSLPDYKKWKREWKKSRNSQNSWETPSISIDSINQNIEFREFILRESRDLYDQMLHKHRESIVRQMLGPEALVDLYSKLRSKPSI